LIEIKILQDQSKLLFGEVALKQNMVEVSMKTLRSINPNNITTSNLLYKIHLEAKCVQKNEIHREVSTNCVYIYKLIKFYLCSIT